MDIIFLDTSIFEANNFLEGKKIKEIYKLSENGKIKVILPELTYDEIINRLKKNIKGASKKFNKYRNDTRILRNANSVSEKFKEFDVSQIEIEVEAKLCNRFKKSNFEIIPYPTLNIKDIFESSFPFSSGSKKYEFPDAFALKSVEEWASEKKVQVLAFSKDKDILNYISPHLEIIDDFDKYLSDKIKQVEVLHKKHLNQIEHIINFQSADIKEEIKWWVESQLDDFSKYYEYSNSYEIHDLQIIEINIDIQNYNITGIDQNLISVELRVSVSYEVEIIIDDEDYMIKDYETKEWIFLETKPVLIDETRYIEVNVIFEVEPDDDTVYEPFIEEINGGKSLNI